MGAVLALDLVSDWTQFRAAAALLRVPSQNLVYADVHGTIGYQLPGQVPRRRAGDGRAPAPRWDTRYDWRGMIPCAQLPYVKNPPSGVIDAPNNQVAGA